MNLNMHFLKTLVENPKLEDPTEKYMNIHRHFYRYSRGEFIGPAIQIYETKTRISVKGSHEYEDLIQEIVTKSASKDEINCNGILISGRDISEELTNLGLEWDIKKSTGKTKNYKAKFNDTIKKNIILESIETFREHSYFLLSFNVSSTCKVSTNKRLPQPSKKKVEEDDVSKRLSFCNGVIPPAEKHEALIIDEVLPDFKADMPDKWKKLTLTNNYIIDKIAIPKKLKDTRLMRIMAIREGKMIRTLDIDGEIIEKQYNIVV